MYVHLHTWPHTHTHTQAVEVYTQKQNKAVEKADGNVNNPENDFDESRHLLDDAIKEHDIVSYKWLIN